MKTAEELIKDHDYGNGKLDKKGVLEAMRTYAEQFIDLAAEQSQEMIYDRQDQQVIESGQGLLLRDFQVCYATPKQSILKLKELLK